MLKNKSSTKSPLNKRVKLSDSIEKLFIDIKKLSREYCNNEIKLFKLNSEAKALDSINFNEKDELITIQTSGENVDSDSEGDDDLS